MLGDIFGQALENPVELVLARPRVEAIGIDKEIDVLRETGDQAPALREAGSTLEHHLVAEPAREDAEDLGDVVVLLDELLGEPVISGGEQQRLFEVGMLEKPHFACQSSARRSERSLPKSNRLRGLRLFRSRLRCRVGLSSSSPIAPNMARTRGGSAKATSTSVA